MVFADAGAHEPVARGEDPGAWCGQCGLGVGDGDHARCAVRAELEPPRYCIHCRRRMKVQVTPGAWTATCIEHGSVERSTWA
ncbi:hypothetical protein G7075_15510 [Phycicoccus sp. HDW14]|uniref:biotin synthase auxiliary protein BsaP n=1 Tax=Phycicoccus sp. HDW14 TaxID=2714941 RepID=UPI00140DF16F|nr:hypothetical protein [Phycicoccus sp. HDW14]QIM22222.1 hypothetical protein G7075_15510 [Phycicoccus sp. HDW14]